MGRLTAGGWWWLGVAGWGLGVGSWGLLGAGARVLFVIMVWGFKGLGLQGFLVVSRVLVRVLA